MENLGHKKFSEALKNKHNNIMSIVAGSGFLESHSPYFGAGIGKTGKLHLHLSYCLGSS